MITGASDSGMVMNLGSTSRSASGIWCTEATSAPVPASSLTGPAQQTTGVITYPERVT